MIRQKISILLPIHNAAPWISETIRSIQAQSYTDWELISINDFSTDDSVEILHEIVKIDSRIHLIQNERKGIIPALQLGLQFASGDFLTRMDGDDIMPERRLEQMITHLNSLPPKSIVTGKVRYFSEVEVSDGYKKYEAWLNGRVDKSDFFEHIYRECVVASPNWLVRTTEMIESGIIDQLNYPEDYDMAFRWMKNGFSIHGIDEVTLLWREHPQRTSRNSEVYNQASFFGLKLKWFCELNATDSIAVLGAGTKGKLAARFLLDHNIDFTWHDLDWKNYNSPIFGKAIEDYSLLNSKLVLIAIYPEKKKPLLAFLHEKGFRIGENAWFL